MAQRASTQGVRTKIYIVYYHIDSILLFKRSFQVLLNRTDSKEYKILAGVPQGSVLSPTLYHLHLTISLCKKGMYADGATVEVSAKSTAKIVKNINETSKDLFD